MVSTKSSLITYYFCPQITIFRIADKYDQKPQELDQIILTALFKSQHLSPTEQLSLALTWNRADIARSEIFIYGQEWPAGALEEAMIKALEHDRYLIKIIITINYLLLFPIKINN